MRFDFIVFVFFSLMFQSEVFAWGNLGHRIVGEIAEQNLNKRTKRKLTKIMGKESLAKSSIFPDEMRSDSSFRFASALHFVDMPVDQEHYLEEIAAPEGDVVQGILMMTEILKNKYTRLDKHIIKLSNVKLANGNFKYIKEELESIKLKLKDSKNAVRFLVHFVGDLHQPLHAGNGKDFGSNNCFVLWMGEWTNLHALWDESLVRHHELSYTEFSNELIAEFEGEKVSLGSALDWALESSKIRPLIYPQLTNEFLPELQQPYCLNNARFSKRNKDGLAKYMEEKFSTGELLESNFPSLSYDYQFKTQPLLKQRLYFAGIRLADLLNKIL